MAETALKPIERSKRLYSLRLLLRGVAAEHISFAMDHNLALDKKLSAVAKLFGYLKDFSQLEKETAGLGGLMGDDKLEITKIARILERMASSSPELAKYITAQMYELAVVKKELSGFVKEELYQIVTESRSIQEDAAGVAALLGQ